MPTLALFNEKGGSGKTTLAIALAAEWRMQGRRVLLVDADPQGAIEAWARIAAGVNRPIPTVVRLGATLDRDDQLPQLSEGFGMTIIDCPTNDKPIIESALRIARGTVELHGPRRTRRSHQTTA